MLPLDAHVAFLFFFAADFVSLQGRMSKAMFGSLTVVDAEVLPAVEGLAFIFDDRVTVQLDSMIFLRFDPAPGIVPEDCVSPCAGNSEQFPRLSDRPSSDSIFEWLADGRRFLDFITLMNHKFGRKIH